MLRKWILSAVAGLTLLTPLAAVSAAQAREPVDHRREYERDHRREYERDHCRYEVMYRPCCNDPWSCYGSFGCREEAERAEHYLRSQGYEAFCR